MYIQFSSCFYGVYSLKKSEKTKLVAQNEFQMYFEERIWWKFSGKFLRLGKLQVHKLQFEIKMDCTLDVFLINLQNGKWDLQKSCFFLNIAEKSRKWECLYSFCSERTVVSEIWNKKICSSKIQIFFLWNLLLSLIIFYNVSNSVLNKDENYRNFMVSVIYLAAQIARSALKPSRSILILC